MHSINNKFKRPSISYLHIMEEKYLSLHLNLIAIDKEHPLLKNFTLLVPVFMVK